MRHIGHLSDEAQARVFGDFLVAKGIRNQVDRDGTGPWSVWVFDEDRVAAAQTWLEWFRANPNAPEFRKAAGEAARLREAEARAVGEFRRRVRTGRSLFPKLGRYGAGLLTYGLILICIAVAIYSNLGSNYDLLRHLFIADPAGARDKFLPEVLAGQVWRLFTPIFIHFGPVHLIFNLMWLFQLGCMIEGRQGTGVLAALVAVVALCSNLAQFFAVSPAFGGMSGVVYGLAGYVWMRGRYDPASGLFLDSRNVAILLVWMALCFTGFLGPVANMAHLAGLIVGVVWGLLSAYLATRRPE